MAEQKTNAINTFENGMNTDIHPIRIDNKTLRYARNIDFITAGTGNELILQKRDGNAPKISSIDDTTPVTITSGYIPVAVAEMNNVLYIVSYNSAQNKGEIGTYPSPDYSGDSNAMLDKYAPLNNYDDGTETYNSPFRTRFLNFFLDGFVDIRLQPSYDGSVNIIITDDTNPVRIFNSRFAVDESGKYAELIKRRTGNSTNSYSDEFFNHSELIPRSTSVAKLDFLGTIDGGSLTAGGYRYFFRYVDADGATTDLIEESRLISLHIGNSPETSYGQDGSKNTNKAIKFLLSSLDKAYYGIKVYYTVSSGEIDPVTKGWEIDTPFKIDNDTGICNIVHTGFESVVDYNKEELALTYSPISNCKTLTVSNDRLILANTESEFSSEAILDLSSSSLKIEEDTFDVYNSNIPGLDVVGANANDNYSNTEFEYNKTGYWKGETYELGIVYVTDSGNSPVYPIQGLDRLEDSFDLQTIAYPGTLKGPNDSTFGSDGLNSKGVYRTASNGNLFTIDGNYMKFTGTKLKVDVTPLLDEVTTLPDGYLQTTDVAGGTGGWRIVYNPDTRKYYLWGTVTNTFDGEVADLTDAVFNPQSIPLPSRTVNFGFVKITTDGKVYDNGLIIGDNVSKTFGPPIDVKNLANGFFFVRRKRIRDKVIEGLTVPAAAFPSTTKFGVKEEFGYPGNWVGCGTTTVGNPVVLAPAPSLCFPMGTPEAINTDTNDIDEEVFADYLDDGNSPTVIVESVVVDPSLAKYDGIAAADKTIDIKLSYVKDDFENVLFTGVDVDPAVQLTGIPVESINEESKIITVKIQYFAKNYLIIPAGTKVQTPQKIANLETSGSSIDFIIRAPIKDYSSLKGWAMYSPDVECSPAYYASQMKNASMSVALQQSNIEGAVQSLSNPDTVNVSLPYATYISSGCTLNNSSSTKLEAKIDYVPDGSISTGSRSFTGILDRVIYAWYRKTIGDVKLTYELMKRAIQGVKQISSDTKGNRDDNPFEGKIFRYGIDDKRELDHYKHDNRRPGSAIKYGRYLGLKMETANVTQGVAPLGTLNADFQEHPTGDPSDLESRNINFETSLQGMNGYFTDNSKFAAYTQIFSSNNGTHITPSNWEDRYNDDSDIEYFAISRRYSFEEFTEGLSPIIDLYGGDCYLGLSWKQIWFPLGISEAPQATDVTAYSEDRRNLGMLNYGYVIGVPAQSNNNFHLRVPEIVDEAEYKAIGKERSFIPLRSVLESRGNKIFDTGRYNFGYSDQDRSDNQLFKLSDAAPYYKSIYPNRIYASDTSSQGDFVNGFTQFKALNFKDYNTELGPITRVVSLKDKVVAVFTSGIGLVGINERTQVSTDTGGVFVDNADVLAQKATILSSTYGSTHPNSILPTEDYVYGVDVSKRKIWRTAGNRPEFISDNRIQTLLGEILDEIRVFTNVNPTDRWIDVFTSYDPHKRDVIFTFYGKDRTNPTLGIYRTIVFNESPGLNTWICETDDHRKYSFATRYDRLAFTPVINFENQFYYYDMNATFDSNNIFRGTQFDAQIKYSMADNATAEKLYENIWIVGDNPLPDSVNYFSAYSNKIPLTANSQLLSPYTNVVYPLRYIDGTVTQVTGSMIADSKVITMNVIPNTPPPGRSDVLRLGDYITVSDPNSYAVYYFTVISVNGLQITVDKSAPVTLTGILNYGYKSPIRLTDSSVEDGYGKIVCQVTNDINSFDRKLRGKWFIVGMDFKGEDQIFINNIVSSYTRSFS